MWIHRSFLCVSLVWGLALDSNTIRSSKEAPPQSSEQPQLIRSWRDAGGCSNRAQRRAPSAGRQPDRHQVRDGPTDSFNRTGGPEMSSCVRSGDCAAGLCCVRYLTGRRCQRIPQLGEACLPRGATKRRGKLGRCNCAAGLTCAAAAAGGQRQGVCVVLSGPAQRKTGNSGRKKKRTAERSC